MSNESIHKFVCASVAACIASIYPRADPERFVKIVNRTKAPACAPETLSDYCARACADADRSAEAERLRTFLKDCRCPCCDARARLRALSYDRACHSAADIHCAATDRRDDNADAAERALFQNGPAACADAEIAARKPRSEETVFPTLDRLEEDTGAGPAGTD